MKRMQAILCVLILMFVALALAVPSLAFLYVPRSPPQTLFVTPLDMVPADGIPRMFRVHTEDRDAWVLHPVRACGRCYLLREGEQVRAFLPISSRGSSVFYNAETDTFEDRCFGVQFDLDGTIRRDIDRQFMLPLQGVPITVDGKGMVCVNSLNSLRPAFPFGFAEPET
jgi:hypothetical protein